MTELRSNGIYFDKEKNRYRAEVCDKYRTKRIRKRFRTRVLAQRWIRKKVGRVPSNMGTKINWRFDFADIA